MDFHMIGDLKSVLMDRLLIRLVSDGFKNTLFQLFLVVYMDDIDY